MNRHERRKQLSEARRATKRDGIRPTQNTASSAFDPVADAVTRQIRGDLTEESAVRAAATAAQAMDDALAGTWNEAKIAPACKRGCSYCCSVPVSVTGPEILRLVAHARATLSPDELARVQARAEANARLTHGTTTLDYPPRLDCAFLGDDRSCLVHAARPLMCRREHALDVAQCKKGYDWRLPGKTTPSTAWSPRSWPVTSCSTGTIAPSPRRGSMRRTTSCKRQHTSHSPIRRPSRAGSKDSPRWPAREATRRSIRGRFQLRARRAGSSPHARAKRESRTLERSERASAVVSEERSVRSATRKHVDFRLQNRLAHGSREQEGCRRIRRDGARYGGARQRNL